MMKQGVKINEATKTIKLFLSIYDSSFRVNLCVFFVRMRIRIKRHVIYVPMIFNFSISKQAKCHE